MISVQTNVAALEAANQLEVSNNNLNQSLERLSSGYRINSAADDSAGLSMSNKFVAQIDSMNVAQQNTSQATALLQIAEGGADQISQILARLKELATEANSANSGSNTGDIQTEAQQLQQEITRIANSTTFQGSSLLNGTWGQGVGAAGSTTAAISVVGYMYGFNYANAAAGTYSVQVSTVNFTLTITDTNTGVQQTLSVGGAGTFDFTALGISFSLATGVTPGTFLSTVSLTSVMGTFSVAAGTTGGAGNNIFQIGETNNAYYQIQVSLANMTASALAVDTASMTLDGSVTTAGTAMTAIDCAINTLNTGLANIGAYEDRLGYASSNLSVGIQNATAANSAIKDVDMATEMTNFTKEQVLVQAGTAMLAQANASAQNILTLFK